MSHNKCIQGVATGLKTTDESWFNESWFDQWPFSIYYVEVLKIFELAIINIENIFVLTVKLSRIKFYCDLKKVKRHLTSRYVVHFNTDFQNDGVE